jgi:hypothetical protein
MSREAPEVHTSGADVEKDYERTVKIVTSLLKRM